MGLQLVWQFFLQLTQTSCCNWVARLMLQDHTVELPCNSKISLFGGLFAREITCSMVNCWDRDMFSLFQHSLAKSGSGIIKYTAGWRRNYSTRGGLESGFNLDHICHNIRLKWSANRGASNNGDFSAF